MHTCFADRAGLAKLPVHAFLPKQLTAPIYRPKPKPATNVIHVKHSTPADLSTSTSWMPLQTTLLTISEI